MNEIVVADYSECPFQEVVADAKHGWCCTERCQKVLIPFQENVYFQKIIFNPALAIQTLTSMTNTSCCSLKRSKIFLRPRFWAQESASCCQRHAVTAVFPSSISVSIVIRLLTVSPVLSQCFSHI